MISTDMLQWHVDGLIHKLGIADRTYIIDDERRAHTSFGLLDTAPEEAHKRWAEVDVFDVYGEASPNVVITGVHIPKVKDSFTYAIALHELGHVALMTGDELRVAEWVRKELLVLDAPAVGSILEGLASHMTAPLGAKPEHWTHEYVSRFVQDRILHGLDNNVREELIDRFFYKESLA